MLSDVPDRASVLRRVEEELAIVRGRRGAVAEPVEEHTRLSELGISSLDLAEIVSGLETAFGVDPFAERVPITSLTDVGSLCDAYVETLGAAAPSVDPLDDELRAIRSGRLPRDSS